MLSYSQPTTLLVILFILAVVVIPPSACWGETTGLSGSIPFCPQTFQPDRSCTWKPSGLDSVRTDGRYFAGPTKDQSREAWLAQMRKYRQVIRRGGSDLNVAMSFDGKRTWVRLAPLLSKMLDLRPGEQLRVEAEVRRLSGSDNLCVAFDLTRKADDLGIKELPVAGVVSIPKDRKWHRLVVTAKVPEFNKERHYLRPIFGMHASHNKGPGEIEIRNIQLKLDDLVRTKVVKRAALRITPKTGLIDRSLYDREDLAWAARTFACHFTFMYDRSFYDLETGQYTLDTFLDDGLREFGGYDAILLWQGYPRLGVDDRNQLDMYRDMPGGLTGIRDLVRRAHDRGVKVFIDYNPWDRGTRREERTDDELLAELVSAIEADGIFLDTMAASSPRLRKLLDEAQPGVVLAPEGYPSIDQISRLSMSWAQWFEDPYPAGLLYLKWLEPRHMQQQIHRWDLSHTGEIESAFFNGSGMLIWENIFGTYNPWPKADRVLWRRSVSILRHFSKHFSSDSMDPFYPTLVDKLYANRWPGDGAIVFTLYNTGESINNKALLEIPASKGINCYDLWTGQTLKYEQVGGNKVRLIGSIERMGSVLAIEKSKIDQPLKDLLAQQCRNAAITVRSGFKTCSGRSSESAVSEFFKRNRPTGTSAATDTTPDASFETGSSEIDERNIAQTVVEPHPVKSTKPLASNNPPAGMVHVPAATICMNIEHVRRECGCYPDPGTPPDKWVDFLWGWPFSSTIQHNIGPIKVKSFFIDEAEVSNAKFKRFLDATKYKPKYSENFLKHWPDGKMPAELADHPVVYVDLDDARAYAKWAGKRLPTEAEWHLVAQGTDGREWPWGNEFVAANCNTSGNKTMPVNSLPAGRSPYGCYHMSGNVWEWTESYRDDGHTRFVMLRGGSYYKAAGSIWYFDGGPRPCNHHAKFILMWPGLDRCATVGFRCVVDVIE